MGFEEGVVEGLGFDRGGFDAGGVGGARINGEAMEGVGGKAVARVAGAEEDAISSGIGRSEGVSSRWRC